MKRALHAALAVAAVLSFAGSMKSDARNVTKPINPKSWASAMHVRIAKSALAVAKSMHSIGWCYRGVTLALKPFGVILSGNAAYEAKDLLLNDQRFVVVKASDVDELKVGDILVHGPSATHPYGHIAVYLGNNHEASDHVQQVVMSGPYSGKTVFRVRTDVGEAT